MRYLHNFIFLFFVIITSFVSRFAFANDASIDPTFYQGDGIDTGGVNSIAIQSDSKILIGGAFNSYDGVKHRGIIRVNQSGSIDMGFNQGYGLNSCIDEDGIDNCFINTISIENNGNIIVGGSFTHFNDLSTGSTIKLFKDGTLDESFHSLGGTNNSVYASFIDSDNKILLAGNFTTYNGKPFKTLIRLNPDGSIDNNFKLDFNDGATINNIDKQPDGKIIIAGWFNNINGQVVKNIARLNQNGSLDDEFNYQVGSNMMIKDFAIDQEGGIIVVGHFTLYNNLPWHYIVRLDNEGKIDKNFNIGTGANDVINTVSLDNEGRIIIGGRFKKFNGESRIKIARLNKDGSLDKYFDPGSSFNEQVFTSLVDQKQRIMLGGLFTEYNDSIAKYLIRLKGDNQ